MRRYDFKEGGNSYLPEHPEGRFVLYTGIERQLQQARREGWEQGKRECVEILKDYCKREMAAKGFGKGWQSLAADAIAAMEYGGEK